MATVGELAGIEMTKEAANPLASILSGLMSRMAPGGQMAKDIGKSVGNFVTDKGNWGAKNYKTLAKNMKRVGDATPNDSNSYAKWALNRLGRSKAPAAGTAAMHAGVAGGATTGLAALISSLKEQLGAASDSSLKTQPFLSDNEVAPLHY